MFQKYIDKVKFYPSAHNFTQALLVMLVTNIMSGICGIDMYTRAGILPHKDTAMNVENIFIKHSLVVNGVNRILLTAQKFYMKGSSGPYFNQIVVRK